MLSLVRFDAADIPGCRRCNTSTNACNWCRKASDTVGFPLLVPRDTVVVPFTGKIKLQQ